MRIPSINRSHTFNFQVKINVKQVSEEEDISQFSFAGGKEYILEYSKDVHEQYPFESDASKSQVGSYLVHIRIKHISAKQYI